MKVMTILGTRPEIIRLSIIIRRLDEQADQHVLVHTGQNHDDRLTDIFFRELHVRPPNHQLTVPSHRIGAQLGRMFDDVDALLAAEQPDKVLVLGDTNSALCALLAVRRGIPVYHMEAGNRCFDPVVPEEINRHVIDAVSTYHLPYTEISRENLLREGAAPNRIWVCGNPIYEVLQTHQTAIDGCPILTQLGLHAGEYILVTAHRAENVDSPDRLRNILTALHRLAQETGLDIICSVHPRTAERLQAFGFTSQDPRIRLFPPFGLFAFTKLEKEARCVLTDSGTVQEECCIFGVPTVTIRQSTERPETVLCGSNVVSGLDADRIVACTRLVMANPVDWERPHGYCDPDVSRKVTHFVLGGLTYV